MPVSTMRRDRKSVGAGGGAGGDGPAPGPHWCGGEIREPPRRLPVGGRGSSPCRFPPCGEIGRAWEGGAALVETARRPVRIGVVGKYVSLPDAYLSVVEALRHAGFHHAAKIDLTWIHSAEQMDEWMGEDRLQEVDGIVIPGGFGERG